MGNSRVVLFFTSADLFSPLSAEATFDLLILSSESVEVEAERGDEGREGKGTNAKKDKRSVRSFNPSQKISSNQNSPEKGGPSITNVPSTIDRAMISGQRRGRGGRSKRFSEREEGVEPPNDVQTVTI